MLWNCWHYRCKVALENVWTLNPCVLTRSDGTLAFITYFLRPGCEVQCLRAEKVQFTAFASSLMTCNIYNHALLYKTNKKTKQLKVCCLPKKVLKFGRKHDEKCTTMVRINIWIVFTCGTELKRTTTKKQDGELMPTSFVSTGQINN